MMNIYHRPDAVTGCGYVIEWGGMKQHSVAWPDRPAERFRDEDLIERGIEVRQVVDAHSEPFPLESAPAEPLPLEEPTAEESPLDPIPEPVEPVSITPFDASLTEAENIRIALEDNPEATNRQVIDRLHAVGINVSSSQISRERRSLTKAAEAVEQEG